MEVSRGEIWWAQLDAPRGSAPGYTRPLVIVQANSFNCTRIRTVIGVVLTTNLVLAEMPGNVLLRAGTGGLDRDSVANVTQIVTVDREFLGESLGRLPAKLLRRIDEGLLLVLSLRDA
jgi:mRNA interferase MazF